MIRLMRIGSETERATGESVTLFRKKWKPRVLGTRY